MTTTVPSSSTTKTPTHRRNSTDVDLVRDPLLVVINMPIFVVEEVPAWRTHIASRAKARRSPKVHLVDPSLTAAMLNTGVDGLLGDLSFAGRFFESMVLRDLQVYAQSIRCTVSHYRDSDNLEVDAIIEHPDRKWVAVEIKLGGREAIEQAARTLLRLRDKLDLARVGEPARLVVVTADGFAYQRRDGVCIAPLTSLGP